MLVLTTSISTLVHLYGISYMSHDPHVRNPPPCLYKQASLQLTGKLVCAALRQGQRMHGSAPDLNGGSFALSPAEINSLRQGHPLLRCLNVLNHVMHQPAAAPFCSQVFTQYFHAPVQNRILSASRGLHRPYMAPVMCLVLSGTVAMPRHIGSRIPYMATRALRFH